MCGIEIHLNFTWAEALKFTPYKFSITSKTVLRESSTKPALQKPVSCIDGHSGLHLSFQHWFFVRNKILLRHASYTKISPALLVGL